MQTDRPLDTPDSFLDKGENTDSFTRSVEATPAKSQLTPFHISCQ